MLNTRSMARRPLTIRVGSVYNDIRCDYLLSDTGKRVAIYSRYLKSYIVLPKLQHAVILPHKFGTTLIAENIQLWQWQKLMDIEPVVFSQLCFQRTFQ